MAVGLVKRCEHSRVPDPFIRWPHFKVIRVVEIKRHCSIGYIDFLLALVIAIVISNKLCAWRHNMPPPPASWQYLRIYSPGGTCSGMLAISDISNKLTFWPWKWCPSHVWRGLPLFQ